jgi:hypothetical protein
MTSIPWLTASRQSQWQSKWLKAVIYRNVIAAFLVLDEEAESIQETAERFATGRHGNLDYLLPDLRKNISEARRSAHQGSV